MNIDNLTIAEAKQIAAMFTQMVEPKNQSITRNIIGKYVIVRSRNEGVNAGYVLDADETGIVLESARRLWYHKPVEPSESWYEGVANHGLSPDSKISAPTQHPKTIVENYCALPCTEKAQRSIEGFPSHAQK